MNNNNKRSFKDWTDAMIDAKLNRHRFGRILPMALIEEKLWRELNKASN